MHISAHVSQRDHRSNSIGAALSGQAAQRIPLSNLRNPTTSASSQLPDITDRVTISPEGATVANLLQTQQTLTAQTSIFMMVAKVFAQLGRAMSQTQA